MVEDKNGGPNYLRAWREHREMSRDELGAAIEPPTTGAVIWHLEEGERGLSAKWLRKLAPALGISPGHLLDLNPDDLGSDVLEIWSRASQSERGQIAALAKTVLGFGSEQAKDEPPKVVDIETKAPKARVGRRKMAGR